MSRTLRRAVPRISYKRIQGQNGGDSIRTGEAGDRLRAFAYPIRIAWSQEEEGDIQF